LETAAPPAVAAEDGGGLWPQLARALQQRLSAATYAAWVAPAQAAPGDGSAAAGGERRLTVILPTAFALDRWRRPPIAPALEEAAAALGMAITLEVRSDPPRGREQA
jgi:hypothetical protein